MKKSTAAFAGLFIVSLSLIFSGCKKETKNDNTNTLDITLSTGSASDLSAGTQKWHITNKRICVLFGYDFNNTDTRTQILELLKKEFGLAEDGGLILPIIYPDDFKHGAKGYASDFAAILASDDLDLAGVVLLGAPENTHTAIAKNQDKWDLNVPYPVIALFPQDDVLGIESTCDIVVDKGQTAELTGEVTEEESDGKIYSEAPELIVDTIKYILSLDGSLQRNQSVQTHLKQILKDRSFHHYMDPETGLQSINHFVIN